MTWTNVCVGSKLIFLQVDKSTPFKRGLFAPQEEILQWPKCHNGKKKILHIFCSWDVYRFWRCLNIFYDLSLLRTLASASLNVNEFLWRKKNAQEWHWFSGRHKSHSTLRLFSKENSSSQTKKVIEKINAQYRDSFWDHTEGCCFSLHGIIKIMGYDDQNVMVIMMMKEAKQWLQSIAQNLISPLIVLCSSRSLPLLPLLLLLLLLRVKGKVVVVAKPKIKKLHKKFLLSKFTRVRTEANSPEGIFKYSK